MRKELFFIPFLSFVIAGKAQVSSNAPGHFHYSFSPVKATVYVTKGPYCKGLLSEISDSIVSMISLQSKDSGSLITIAIKDIKRIRIKRNALAIGSISGGGAGFVLGGLVGLAAEQGPRTDAGFMIGGFAGMIPGAIIGAGVGSITIRGRFSIKGNKEKINRLGKILVRRDKILHP